MEYNTPVLALFGPASGVVLGGLNSPRPDNACDGTTGDFVCGLEAEW